jgi:hypothetical protein
MQPTVLPPLKPPVTKPTLSAHLDLLRCPHCSIDKPNLQSVWSTETTNHRAKNTRFWRVYRCNRCGGLIIAASPANEGFVDEIYPTVQKIDSDLPERARAYLEQAQNSLHAPDGAVMLAASAIDAMLKQKNYKEGSLKARIDEAASKHLITEEMAKWAHEVRLDANEQRHSDETTDLANEDDARRSIEFAMALGTFLFVLPARVQRGLDESASEPKISDEERARKGTPRKLK